MPNVFISVSWNPWHVFAERKVSEEPTLKNTALGFRVLGTGSSRGKNVKCTLCTGTEALYRPYGP